jgi:hypothetical protein
MIHLNQKIKNIKKLDSLNEMRKKLIKIDIKMIKRRKLVRNLLSKLAARIPY